MSDKSQVIVNGSVCDSVDYEQGVATVELDVESPINPKTGEPYFAMSDAPFNSNWVAHNPVVIPID